MTEHLSPRPDQSSPVPFALVKDELKEVEKLILRHQTPEEGHLGAAACHVRAAAGKRLRPAAFLLMVRLLDERPGLPHIVTAAVLELCHTATLLHDDVLDHASVRRGRASLNAVRGNREAVLYGDHLLAGAFQLLADLARPELVLVTAGMIRQVCAGEIRQWTEKSFDLTEAEYFAIVRAKTASFFRAAGTLAGRLACLGRTQTVHLEAWGDAFGTAYQIADDLYDLVTPERPEKSTGRDARSGLLTLPWIRLRDRRGMQALRERYLASPSRSASDLCADGPLFEAITASAREATRFLARAHRALEEFPASEARAALIGLGRKLSATVRGLARPS
jgi:geranylgeranyl pyrophosphate synthase